MSNNNEDHDWPINEPRLPSPIAEARDYQASVEAGTSIEGVARKAQRTVAHVKHRLKLLELVPKYAGK